MIFGQAFLNTDSAASFLFYEFTDEVVIRHESTHVAVEIGENKEVLILTQIRSELFQDVVELACGHLSLVALVQLSECAAHFLPAIFYTVS